MSLILRIFFLGTRDLLAEEAYYWNYAAHLDFGYIDHPPMVGLLIKMSTLLLGINEFAVRFPAVLCWGVSTYYSYRWCELIHIGTGRYALLLMSVLPFFFLFASFMTPDLPLLAAWSAALYYLYRALGLNQRHNWYCAAVAVGLGCLSKYTMSLMVLATGVYLITSPTNRRWLLCKEPYIAGLIVLLLFSPVIYWNATHDWISFHFQGARRFQGEFSFSLHKLLGIFALFLTPVGIMEFGRFFKKNQTVHFDPVIKRFIQFYTLVPLLFFAMFSLFRGIKWNWIGPSGLALMPWFALCMFQQESLMRKWLTTSHALLLAYAMLFFCATFGHPAWMSKTLLVTIFDWEKLTQDFSQIASKEVEKSGKRPIFVPLDNYNIASELTFYQAKFAQNNSHFTPYLVNSPTIFHLSELMFDIWNQYDTKGKTLILISVSPHSFLNPSILEKTQALSPIKHIWSKSQGYSSNKIRFYYQLVYMQ